MAGPGQPEQVDGLLEKIADTALDDDYYVVRGGPGEQSRQFNTVLTAVVLGVFALLVAIAAIQTRTDRPATERERDTLISDINARKEQLARREATAERLRTSVAELNASVAGFDAGFEELRLLASDRGAAGPGVRVTVSSGPDAGRPITDRDLQTLVNGLWYAGAEAIAINGKRIGPQTSIRSAGGVIKVNYEPIGEPFEIEALGDPAALEDRFGQSAVGRAWEQRRKASGVRFDIARSDDLVVESAPKNRLTVKHAKAVKGDE
ncbi:DUF881 domain-containing protein [Aeromicrobium wangtongii]|uniref:DUF881 domain-containing protein n=1 Tax=Aeromicrobium wangtongii TaxID=2969247 RepID=A0ABY5M3V1_9ACTN|nr:DUF881 domain-containing protein [Aeromicrobium wangtongii]MCD9198113.1 DUF881 domain-containing protein [Aeromicrobium wangtongii]MCL3819169.1 DUF881 domain-containing protein [Aeromicrobium wangtongii]UUP12152.1 DUF881 domain-containing protein [Aeromicrobium wangtongii]